MKPPEAPAAAPAQARTAQDLASRGLSKELAGDHAGALADLEAALAAETDPERRRGIESLLRLLEAK